MTNPKWIMSQFPAGFVGYAVELGALDGVTLSNTLLLEENGWEVLYIEPNPRWHEALTKNRKLVMRCACDRNPSADSPLFEVDDIEGNTYTAIRFNRDSPNWTNGWPHIDNTKHKVVYDTTVLTLDQCLRISGFPSLQVLSLDVDGLERDIMGGFDLEYWKPHVVVIEEDLREMELADLLPGYKHIMRDEYDGCYVRVSK